MKKTNIEVEGGELILMSEEGHYAIIPAKDRSKVKEMINNKSDDSINDYIKYLPKESDYAEDGSLIEGFENPFEPEVSTPDKPIFADEKKGYGEVKKENPVPLNTPYGRQYKNIVDKQRYYDYLSEKYGDRVKYREDFLNLYDKPLETPEILVVNHTMDDYNPSNPNLDKLPQPSKDVQQKLDKYHDLISQHGFLEKKENRDKFLFENYSKEELENMSEENKSDILLDKMRHIRNEYYEIAKEISPMLRDESILEGEKTTWRKEFESRDDISNKSLLYSSMMEEGGNKYQNKSIISGFSHFGIDRIGDILDELIDGGYLEKDIKNRLEIYPTKNEKNEHINTADFQNFTDVITVKNAILNQERDLILKVAKKEGVELSDKAIEYFTIAGYNGGRGNAAKMLKKFKEDGLLEDDKFLEVSPDSYKRIHENVMRRLDIAKMLKEEGVIK